MSKVLSKKKSAALNFALLFCICLSLLPLNVTAQTIDFSDKTIEELVDLKYMKLHHQKGIEIDSLKLVPSVIFHRPINFTRTTFDSSVIFFFTQFKSPADFGSTKFRGIAHFHWVAFDSSVNFSFAEFDSTADFGITKFKGTANFLGATFDSSISFLHAEFDSTVNFFGTKFEGMAHFDLTKFKGKADFGEAHFGGDVTFSNAILPDTLDFRRVKDISREIDFTLSWPPLSGRKCHIALAGANISKIKLNMALFTLWFPKDIYISYDGQLSVYESVLKKLKDDGLMESYQILDIEYRQLKYWHKGGVSWYIVNTSQKWWWNYGYSKEHVFLWAIGFWFLFSFVNLGLYRRLSESVYTIAFLEKMEESVSAGVRKRLFYFFQVVTYTAIVFFGLKMDVGKFKKGVVREHPWLFVYLMLVYVLGLVCLGFIVNIIFTR
jgi:hypothetical protein